MIIPEPSRDTAAWWRKKSIEELEEALRGGPIGNRSVDSALAELNRRAGDRQEKWARRSFWAAAIAAMAAIVGVIVTAIK